MIKRILEGGGFSSPVDLTKKDEICLGSNRIVKIHSVCMPTMIHVTRWAVIQIGAHIGYIVGGELLHRELQEDGFQLDCEIYLSPRRQV